MTEQLAAYLSGTLSPDRAAEVEAHLAACDSCRADFVATRRVLLQRVSTRPAWILGGGMAAALLLALPAVWSYLRPPGAPDIERAPTSSSTVLPIVAPAEGARAEGERARLVWRSAGVETQYRLTVTDSAGGRVWSGETADTTVTLAPGLTASPGSYYWIVDALLPDGRVRSTGTHRFSTPR